MRITLPLTVLAALIWRSSVPAHAGDEVSATADTPTKKPVRSVGHVKLKSDPPGARIVIDGQAIGVTPLDWELPTGPHTIQMDKPGLVPVTRDIVVVTDQIDVLALELRPPKPERFWSRDLPVGLLVVGGAAIATGGAMFAVDQDFSKPGEPAHFRNSAPAGVGVAIGGAVLSGVGAYLLLFRSPSKTSTPVAVLTSDTAYVGWSGRF
jgi:PEGA domain